MDTYIIDKVTILPAEQHNPSVLRNSKRLQANLHLLAVNHFKRFKVEGVTEERLVGGIRFHINTSGQSSPFIAVFPDETKDTDCVTVGKVINTETGEVVFEGKFQHVQSFDTDGNQFIFEGRTLSALELAGLPVILKKLGIALLATV